MMYVEYMNEIRMSINKNNLNSVFYLIDNDDLKRNPLYKIDIYCDDIIDEVNGIHKYLKEKENIDIMNK